MILLPDSSEEFRTEIGLYMAGSKSGKEAIFMAKVKSTALYPHPFSKAYWLDAAADKLENKA